MWTCPCAHVLVCAHSGEWGRVLPRTGWCCLNPAAPWAGAAATRFSHLQLQPWPLWNQTMVLAKERFLVGGQISSGQVPGEGCVRSSLWPGYPPAQGRRGRPAFSGQGATTACSRELPCNFCMQCEVSGFYFHSMACIGVILPREADGSGMLLVHPGFSGALAVPWLQPVCPGLAPGEVQGRGDGSSSSLGFFCSRSPG